MLVRQERVYQFVISLKELLFKKRNEKKQKQKKYKLIIGKKAIEKKRKSSKESSNISKNFDATKISDANQHHRETSWRRESRLNSILNAETTAPLSSQ